MVTSLSVHAPDTGETMPLDALKMLKLAEQCLERAQSTVAKLGGSPAGFPGASPKFVSSVAFGSLGQFVALCALQGKPA